MDHSGPGDPMVWMSVADVPAVVTAAFVAWWYLVSLRRVNRADPTYPWPATNSVCFFAGLLLALAVVAGPVASASMSGFSMHMVQHIVLMMIATPLLVLGAPVLLGIRAADDHQGRRRWVAVIRSRPWIVLTNPVVSWLVFAAVLVGVHFTPFMSAAMDAGILGRYGEYLLYGGASFFFYYSLLPGNPAANRLSPAARIGSLFLMMVPETMTGFFIYSATFSLVPSFAASAAASGRDGIADQQLGGALMWSTGMIIDVAWIAVAVHEWFESEVSRTRSLDAQMRRESAAGTVQ
ncbi:MAG: hypothetical protein F2840_16130 [Actinobacteria bacterium]|nr:hypothetical protein [Actinomycetota bacterium]